MVVPVTVALNNCCCEAVNDAEDGVTVTLIGVLELSATVAIAVLAGSAALVAVTVTVCALVIEAGAV